MDSNFANNRNRRPNEIFQSGIADQSDESYSRAAAAGFVRILETFTRTSIQIDPSIPSNHFGNSGALSQGVHQKSFGNMRSTDQVTGRGSFESPRDQFGFHNAEYRPYNFNQTSKETTSSVFYSAKERLQEMKDEIANKKQTALTATSTSLKCSQFTDKFDIHFNSGHTVCGCDMDSFNELFELNCSGMSSFI